jgi:hypothetical protein
MKKLKLNLEQLAVSSFAIETDDGRGGTIHGFWISEECATDGLTCNGPVGGSCAGADKPSCRQTRCVADGCDPYA